MKKILGLTVVVLIVMGLVGGGTWAYFSDVETTGTNVLSAGTLNLNVDATDPFNLFISLPTLKPADTGTAANWTVLNDGSISGNLTIGIGAIANGEGINPESETGTIAEPGELGGLATLAVWLDNNQNGAWDGPDQYLDPSGAGTVVEENGEGSLPAAAYDIIDNFGSKDWTTADGIAAMSPNGVFDLLIEYDFPEGGATDNNAQGDNCTFVITFTLMQP